MENKNKISLQRLIEVVVKETLVEVILEQDVVLDDPLIAIFIQPFTDVIKTANAELKKNFINIRGNAKSIAKQAAILAIPFLATEMIDDTHKAAQEEIKSRLGKIDSEYADIYLRNWQSLRSRDIWGIGFMLNPGMGVAAKFAMKAPKATLNMLKTLTAGGLSPENEERLKKAIDFADYFATPVSPNYGSAVSYGGGGYGSGGGFDAGYFDGDFSGEMGGEAISYKGSTLFEQQQTAQGNENSKGIQMDKQTAIKKIAAFVEAFKKQPDVQQAMQNSKISKELQQGALVAVMKTASPILKASSFKDLSQALGSKMEKFEADIHSKMPEDLSPQEQENFKQLLVPEIKKDYKQVLVTQLAKQATSDKVADKNLQQLINQINKM